MLREHRRLVAAAGADLEHLPSGLAFAAAARSSARRRRAARWSGRSRSAAPCPRRRGWRALPRRTRGAGPRHRREHALVARCPSSRRRSTMRARVRSRGHADARRARSHARRAIPARAASCCRVREVDPQRRDRDALRSRPRGNRCPGRRPRAPPAGPIQYTVSPRGFCELDHRLGLVALAQARHLDAAQALAARCRAR